MTQAANSNEYMQRTHVFYHRECYDGAGFSLKPGESDDRL